MEASEERPLKSTEISKMNFYIIGGLGHIGSYLIRELPKRFSNSNFIIIDNLSTSGYSSLFNLNKKYKYEFIHSDIKDLNLENRIRKKDVVIHLAALTNTWESFKKPEIYKKTNYGNSKFLVDLCSKKKSNLIFMSSTSVYNTKKKIINEECSKNELKPDSPYSKIKLKEENLIKVMSKKSNFNYLILRLGTIAGISPGMKFHTVVNKFCWQAVQNLPLTVWKSFRNISRPYLDLKDLNSAIVFLIKKKFHNKTFNLVTENLTTIELINKIKKFLPNIKINSEQKTNLKPNSFNVSNKKISEFNFIFRGNINERIFDTISLLKNSNNIKIDKTI